ncbi:MAG: hypothetical protein KIT56_10420, partial [Gammaproteobacteria bacterium]|nr:hypothetical protein [Gammaproteobacteria bacterium]
CAFVQYKIFNVHDVDHREIVRWLFSLYYNFILFLKENDVKANDQLITDALDTYIRNALSEKKTIQEVKTYITDIINKNKTSNYGKFFNMKGLEKYEDALKELVNKNNPENLNAEDFDYRTHLNLSSAQDYYQAKKSLMKYYNQNSRDKNMVQDLTEDMLVDLLNKSNTYKFYLNLQDKDVVKKLMNDIKKEVNNNLNIVANIQINKIIHAIYIGSTSRGTSPVQNRQIDFWNLSKEWGKKAKKSKYSSFNSGLESEKKYGGADYIKKGLEYVKIKIKTVNDLNALSVLVVQKIKNENLITNNLDSDNVVQILLYKIKNVTLDLNKGEKKNVRAISLLSVIDGYTDLCKDLKIDEPSDKIIELLLVKELHQLITQELITATQEKKIELLYRSCIDLMSLMIALRLGSNDNQVNFINDQSIIFPDMINNSELKKNTSKILVGKSGQHALNEGLKILGCAELHEFSLNKNFENYLPGFHLKSVLSQNKKEDRDRDIAVYFQVGGQRDIYDLALMSSLPNQNPNNAKKYTIYLSDDGKFIVRDFLTPSLIHKGQLDKNFDLSDLKNKLNDSEFRYSILKFTAKADYTQESCARKAGNKDQVACVGRISETIFDIDQYQMNQLNNDVMQWCQNDSGKPKVLCVDITITKPNDELIDWMQSPDIRKLITEKKLDILVWQSEQKQHSLGTGKFSAGSVYLISGDEAKINIFNNQANKSHEIAPDSNLSTFFRHYSTHAMLEVVKQQTESAKFIADQLNTELEKQGLKAVANGPFVIILTKDQNKDLTYSLWDVWPQSWSFGFSQTTITNWDNNSIRISIGLESQHTLEQEVSEVISKIRSNSGLKPNS